MGHKGLCPWKTRTIYTVLRRHTRLTEAGIPCSLPKLLLSQSVSGAHGRPLWLCTPSLPLFTPLYPSAGGSRAAVKTARPLSAGYLVSFTLLFLVSCIISCVFRFILPLRFVRVSRRPPAQVDEFAYGQPDFLPIFAAGNDGQSSVSRSITQPATAKNILTVGATLSPTSAPPLVEGDVFTLSEKVAGSDDRVLRALFGPDFPNNFATAGCVKLRAGTCSAGTSDANRALREALSEVVAIYRSRIDLSKS